MQSLLFLDQKARQIRVEIIKMIFEAGSGHPGSSLGLADFFSAMYFSILNHNPKEPKLKNRDRLIISCGHVVPAQYAAMALSGYFPMDELKELRKIGSRLQGHPCLKSLQSLESSSGPLGQGTSIAIGKALAAKKLKQSHYIYLLMSEGDLQEGQSWEAFMTGSKYKLDNLIAFVDRNNIQLSGKTKDIMPLGDLRNKFRAFGWYVKEVDGNNINSILKAVQRAKNLNNKPCVIILKTIMSKGISFMENNYKWHGKALNKEEAKRALEELKS